MNKPISIVHKEDITDYELLCNNPKITKCIALPYDYILFYFWVPLFKEIFGNTATDRSRKIYSDTELKSKAIELIEEENSLIKPLFARSSHMNFVTAFGFILNNEHYHLKVLRRDKLIKLGSYFENKIVEPKCTTRITFKKLDTKNKSAFDRVVADWVNWCDEHNMKIKPTNIIYNEKEAVLSASFVNGCEDAYATLIIMVNATKNKTGCSLIAFDK